MAKAKSKKKPNGGKKHRKAPNPVMHKKRRRSSNPMGSIIGSPKELIQGGIAGLAAAVATRQLPQVVLGANNSGVEGYAANAVTGIISTWIAGAFAGAAAGRGAAIGSIVILIDRILSENVSPIAQYISLSGVGDANAYSKLGTIRSGFFTHPGLMNPDGSLYVPDPYTDAAMSAVASKYPQLSMAMAQAAAGGGGRVGAVNPSALRRHSASGRVLSSRFQGRFNQ